MAELRAARRELTTAEGEKPDMVVLGSPHFRWPNSNNSRRCWQGNSVILKFNFW